MDCCLSYNRPSLLQSVPSTGRVTNSFFSGNRRLYRPIAPTPNPGLRTPLVVAASSHCEFSSSLNNPLESKSLAGKFLGSVLLNDREHFHVAVAKQLEQLVSEREEAVARMNLSSGSAEACLHRRIAELKELECQTAIEDIMYMLIFFKFSEIRVHMIPRLCKCNYKGRVEICPSRDWELESIHSFEVLEMIREHLTSVVGWRPESNVSYNWTTTKIQRLQLCRVYAASILYGYFLKSASLRHHLELNLDKTSCDLCIGTGTVSNIPLSELWSFRLKNLAHGHSISSSPQSTTVSQVSCTPAKDEGKLRFYVMGFDPETMQMCAKPKSKEAASLIEKHSCALFGDEETGLLENDEVISTSLASLKRFVLEAVAFGSFLWDAEEYVNGVYKLKEN